jgi:copper(I)-binding protein
MKQLILSTLVLICTTPLFAQHADQQVATGSLKKDNTANTKALAVNACATQLLTPVPAGNGNTGIMFDITTNTDVIIKNVGASFSGSDAVVEVYTRLGTHVGFTASNAGWTYHGDAHITGAPALAAVEIPVAIYEKLEAGQVMGVYIHVTNDNNVDYTDGTNVGDTIVSDGTMAILEGTGLPGFGGTEYSPRNLNGFVTYCGDLVCYDDFSNATTTYVTDNGNDGNIFEITALEDFTLKSFYTNCEGSGGWEVYYRNGSYSGFTTSLNDWILLDSMAIVCNGSDDTTAIPLPVYMDIDAGQTVSFYITGTATGAAINYFDGTSEGAIYENYGAFVIKEGLGVAYPLSSTFTPRVFSGGIDYCSQGFVGNDELALSDYSVLVYPNPAKDVVNFSIDSKDNSSEYAILITDLQGRTVAKADHNVASNVSIGTAGFNNGVYFYNVVSETGIVATGTFVKN